MAKKVKMSMEELLKSFNKDTGDNMSMDELKVNIELLKNIGLIKEEKNGKTSVFSFPNR